MPFRGKGNDERAVGIANDLHAMCSFESGRGLTTTYPEPG
jgi:hypothetical protein